MGAFLAGVGAGAGLLALGVFALFLVSRFKGLARACTPER